MEAKIKLKIKNVEIELSIDEADELKTILEGLTGKEIVREVIKEYRHEHYIDHWNDWWHKRYPYEVTWICDYSNTAQGSARYSTGLTNNNDIRISYTTD